MTRRHPALWLAAIGLLASAAACTTSSDVSVRESKQLVNSPDSTSPTSTTEDDDTPPRSACSTDSMDELFIEGDDKPPRPYDDLVRNTVAELDCWWSDVYPELYGGEYEPLQGGVLPAYPEREDPLPGCGSSETTYPQAKEMVAFYCPEGDFILYDDGDDGPFASVVREVGNVTLPVMLAHEWGHAIQKRQGVFNDPSLTTVVTEQQADCFSGAFIARARDGDVPGVELTDADVNNSLIAMIAIQDPPGFNQQDPGGHGTGFDRINAYQHGYFNGVDGCQPLIDDPLPLMPNAFVGGGSTNGNAPWGYDDDELLDFLPESANTYWPAAFRGSGLEFPALDLVPVDDASEADCSDLLGDVDNGAAYCPSSNEVYFDEPYARELYDEFGDFSVGYLLGSAWADAAQERLDSELTGEERALVNDCLTGSWVSAMLPNELGLPTVGNATIEPGDLEEVVLTMLQIGDESRDENIVGSPFEKVDYFRTGAIGTLDACQERIPD